VPVASQKPCRETGCPELVANGYCTKHKAKADARYIRQGAKVYRSRMWQSLRKRVLKEQPWCAVLDCMNLSLHVDHVVPLRDGGAAYDRANLQGLCAKHHGSKTRAEVFGAK
jgi:5-methylcytosine-specific restriction protein A